MISETDPPTWAQTDGTALDSQPIPRFRRRRARSSLKTEARGEEARASKFERPALDNGLKPEAQSTSRTGADSGRASVSGDEDFLLRLYLRDIAAQPLLTSQEEAELGRRARAGNDAARERLALSHLRLVVRIAFDYQGLGLPVCDLISEGNLGLLHAATLFDPAVGARFATYAAVWIKQRIRRALTNQSRLVRLPPNVVECVLRVKAAEVRLGAELGRAPTDDELAEDTDLVRQLIHQLRRAGVQSYIPLHSAPAPEEGLPLAETLADENAQAPDDQLSRQSDREFLEQLLATLKPRDARVLRLRFGLENGTERSLQEVGRTVGLVRQRVQQIEVASLTKLRTRARLARLGCERRVHRTP
jgi:RNA polymerase primary sigma factor